MSDLPDHQGYEAKRNVMISPRVKEDRKPWQCVALNQLFFFLTKINYRTTKEHMYSADFPRLHSIREERSPFAVGSEQGRGIQAKGSLL